eukprot:13174621-Heterocapsa_arctica.AAC.1
MNAFPNASSEDVLGLQSPPDLIKGSGQALAGTRLNTPAEDGMLRTLSHTASSERVVTKSPGIRFDPAQGNPLFGVDR